MNWQDVAADGQAHLRIAVVSANADSSPIPNILRAPLKEMQLTAQVVALEPSPDEFGSCISHLTEAGFSAVSVGNPFKPLAAKLANKFFLVKHSMGLANALTLGPEIYAQNTEVSGFMRLIADREPATALVMGAGQGARSVIAALFESGWQVRLWNRNALRARPLLTLFQRYGKIELLPQPDPSGCSLVVNATPLGVKAGEHPPLLWTKCRPHTVACDLVFRSVPTEFLRQAALRGFTTIDGKELLSEQAALALEWWTGKPVPREPIRIAAGLKR
jgi:shikimate dehydrogenase